MFILYIYVYVCVCVYVYTYACMLGTWFWAIAWPLYLTFHDGVSKFSSAFRIFLIPLFKCHCF